jgi:hypothetical protein
MAFIHTHFIPDGKYNYAWKSWVQYKIIKVFKAKFILKIQSWYLKYSTDSGNFNTAFPTLYDYLGI